MQVYLCVSMLLLCICESYVSYAPVCMFKYRLYYEHTRESCRYSHDFVLSSLCFCILCLSFLSLCLCVSVNKGFQGIHRFNNTLVPSWLKMSIFTIHTNRKAWYAKPVGDAGQSYFFKGYSIWHFLYIREK